MKITIFNEIIQKVEIIKDDYGTALKLNVKSGLGDCIIDLEDINLIEELFVLLKKNSLTQIKNIPIRMIGVKSEEDIESDEKVYSLVAIGDFIENRWLSLDVLTEGSIVSFDEIFDKDVEIEIAI